MKIITAINAGSSSLKVSIYEGENGEPEEIAVAQVDGLTAPPPSFRYKSASEHVRKELKNVDGPEDAFDYILNYLTTESGPPQLRHKDDISYVCHRVVHGGDYRTAVPIEDDTLSQLEKLSDLAPLHNAHSLTIVRTVLQRLKKAKNIACFDSAFHSTIPRHIYTYPIGQDIAAKNKLRKYGFHGLSYSFIVDSVARHFDKPLTKTSIIALHLGSGASVCAVQDGKSLDTTMGLTPLAGLPGATRSGDIDPSLVFHYTHTAGRLSRSSTRNLHITEAEEILNKQSGWKALTGTTDFGKISNSDDENCVLAFDIFIDRILNYVGSYYVKLGGRVDALVFAGGIGEKGAKLRAKIVEGCFCLGFSLDSQKNNVDLTETVTDLSKADSKHKILVCRTDEQIQMARLCLETLKVSER